MSPRDADENLRLALTHLVQIIGEAGRQVSREFSDRHPEIPWADIVGMRHKVVHDYLGVDEDIVCRSSRTACAHETRRDAGAFNEEVVTGAFCLTDHASRRSRRRVVAHNVGRCDRARMGAIKPH